MPKLLESYGSKEQCYSALFNLRWPRGFACPECGNTTYCKIKSRKVYHCHRQTSLTSGTIFVGTKLTLTQWFLAIYLLTQHKSGISALQLKREGRIEMDDTYIGGKRPGKPGRGAHHKTPFIAVIETDEATHRPQRMYLWTASGFRSDEIERYAKANLAPGCRVVNDGLACFATVGKTGCLHMGIVCGGSRKGVQHPSFKWVDTMLGNVKNAITGTFHSVSPKHVPRYLAEFEYRFNRRFRLDNMIERLAMAQLRRIQSVIKHIF